MIIIIKYLIKVNLFGPIASIPKGGHIAPISTVGAIAECPNA